MNSQNLETIRHLAADATNAHNGALLTALSNNGQGALMTHESFKVTDLEKMLPQRRRARGTFSTTFIAPFAAYVAQHKEVGCTVFVNAARMSATAVLNLGTPDVPGHADNLAEVELSRTAGYTALLTLCSNAQSQSCLAEWLEEWKPIVTLLGEDVQEIKVPDAIRAIRDLKITKGSESSSNVQTYSAERSEIEKIAIAAKGELKLPSYLCVTTKPYKELHERKFMLRVTPLTSREVPSFRISTIGHEQHTEEMAQEFSDLTVAGLSAAGANDVPAIIGTYSKQS